MVSGPPRQQLHGYVSAEARDGWYRFAGAHDTNVTALLEAVGIWLGQAADIEPKRLPSALRGTPSLRLSE